MLHIHLFHINTNISIYIFYRNFGTHRTRARNMWAALIANNLDRRDFMEKNNKTLVEDMSLHISVTQQIVESS